MKHMLFGDRPYLYRDFLAKRGGQAGRHGNWHGRWCRKLKDVELDDRVLAFCGLRRITETFDEQIMLQDFVPWLAVTRQRGETTCEVCHAGIERLLELGRAAVKIDRKLKGAGYPGDVVHLLFAPATVHVTALIDGTDPRDWDWSQATPLEQRKRAKQKPRIECACLARNPVQCTQALLRLRGRGGPRELSAASRCDCECHAGTQVEHPHLSVPCGRPSSAARGTVPHVIDGSSPPTSKFERSSKRTASAGASRPSTQLRLEFR